jgi:hypothetical protein
VLIIRNRQVIGSIFVGRDAGLVRRFPGRAAEDLSEQAVIAIENVRLFTELDARNRT